MNIKLNKSIMIQIVFLCPHLYFKRYQVMRLRLQL